MSLIQKIFILLIIVLGLFLRLYRLDYPVADWHSFRQADTASVTRIFSENGIDILHPKYHDLSNIQSGLENPLGYRMVELPIYNIISVYFHQIFKTNIDISSRLVSIIFSLGSGLLIFLICYQQTKLFLPSFFALATFMLLPFNIYYSRTILPEPTAVFFMLLSLYLFPINLFSSAVFLALSILIKPYTAIILFPVFLIKLFTHKKSLIKLIIFSVISISPFIFWRLWISQFPEGIPKSDWLLNNGVTTTFPAWYKGYNLSFLNKLIAFRPHWWQWLFFERVSNLILGAYGLIPLFLGLAFKKIHTQKFSFSLILGILLYFVVIAQGNIQHDYYQVLIIPFVSILLGFGYYYIYSFLFDSKILSSLAILTLFGLSTYFSWNKIKSYYQINNNSIVEAGQKAQQFLPKNSLVIAPYNGDTALLYQTGFSGWPIEIYDIPKLISLHKDNKIYLVSVNLDNYTRSVIPHYKILLQNESFIILELSK